MTKVIGNVIDQYDNPVVGVQVTVRTSDDALATLKNDDGSPLSNPVATDALGAFSYNVLANDVYTEYYRLADSERVFRVSAKAISAATDAVSADLTGANNIGIVATNIANVNLVGPVSGAVTTIAPHVVAIDDVADNIWPVVNVHNNIGIVTTVHDDIANVNTVAGMSAAIATVNGNATNINTVATNNANVTAVGANITAVTTCATNIAGILAAPQAAIDAAAAKDLAVASIQDTLVFGRPAGTTLVTGTNVVGAVYIPKRPLEANTEGASTYEYFNNSGSSKTVKFVRLALTIPPLPAVPYYTQVGSDIPATVPANVAGAPVPFNVTLNALKGEYIGEEPQVGAFTYTATTGDDGGYYQLPANTRSGDQGSLVTNTRHQKRATHHYVAVTGPDYTDTKGRVTSLETGVVQLPSLRFPLDELSAKPFAVLSFRRLSESSSKYALAGNNGGSDTKFGYTSAGLLDTAAMTAAFGGSTGKISRWYDRMGNGDAVQTTASAQPTVTTAGTDAYLTFSSTTNLNLPNLLDFPRFRAGVTIGLILRVPTGVVHSPITFTKGTTVAAKRIGLETNTSGQMRVNITPWDAAGSSSYNSSYMAIPDNQWVAVVASINYRTGTVSLKIGAATEVVETITAGTDTLDGVYSEDSNCLDANLAKFNSVAGTAHDLAAVALYVEPLGTNDRALLWRKLTEAIPGAGRPATRYFFGDSQYAMDNYAGSGITPAVKPVAIFQQLKLTKRGILVPVFSKSANGINATAVQNNFNSVPYDPNGIYYFILGRNNALDNLANHAAVQAIYTAIAAAIPSGRFFFSTIPLARNEGTGTTANTNINTFNTWIKTTFPDNHRDAATYLADGTGRTSDSYLISAVAGELHRNQTGYTVEMDDYEAAEFAKGWV